MSKDIAIIGIAGRFPDARNLDELYQNLLKGTDSVGEISPQRIKDTALLKDKEYMICGYLDDIDKFDHKLFNITLSEAQAMDPLHRQLLEVSYEAIENAGYNVDDFNGSRTAVIVGETKSQYCQIADEFVPTLLTGNDKEYLATRISRTFNLTGNAVMVDTACSSSLVALHLACNELILEDADYALVCGAKLHIFPYQDTDYKLNVYSPHGKSKSFSAEADGMSNGEAVVSVLLKPLERALADRDLIHGVIKGSAVNNNASRAASPSAPDSISQAEVIKAAWQKAGVGPTEIGYIEAHGSGTQLGDSIEVEGLNTAFAAYTDAKQICPISTIKSNIGHTMTASGLASLSKVLISLKNKTLLPTIHFDQPSPHIDFANSAIYVNSKLKEWTVQEGQVRYAGISAIGASGTNCHVIIGEPPKRSKVESDENRQIPYIATFSSKNEQGLLRNIQLYIEKLNKKIHNIEDVCYTTNVGRKHYRYRFAVVAVNTEQLIQQLHKAQNRLVEQPKTVERIKKLIFIFSDYDFVSKELLDYLNKEHPIFAEHYAECARHFSSHDTNFINFAFQYSLYKLLESYGITTENVLGIGIGRIIVSVLRGDLTLTEAVAEVGEYESVELTQIEARVDGLIEREVQEGTVFVQVGPMTQISKALRKKSQSQREFCVLDFSQWQGSAHSFFELIKELYRFGIDLDWKTLWQGRSGQRIELPTYQFEQIRCWLRDEPKVEVACSKGETQSSQQAGPVLVEHAIASGTEIQIAQLWGEILELNSVTLDDDFFNIGGDSLKTTQVVLDLNDRYGIRLSFEDIFDFPTIRLLATYVDSLVGTEEKVASIWKQVLKAEDIQREDDFFGLGGHSLMANQVLAKVEQIFNLELNFEDMYKYPTVAAFAAFIDQQISQDNVSLVSQKEQVQSAPSGLESPASSRNQSTELELERGAIIIPGLKPFNEVMFKNCFYNSLFPVVKGYGKTLDPYLANDLVAYRFDQAAPDCKLKIKYLEQRTIEELMEDQGIAYDGQVMSSNIIHDLKSAISRGRPVIVWIDCYYSSIRTDTYMKLHLPHSLLIYGYNEEDQTCNIIEHEHHDSLNYQKQVIHFNDLIASYNGYINNFQNKEKEVKQTYLELYQLETKDDNSRSRDAYRSLYLHNLKANQEFIFTGLAQLQEFEQELATIAGDEERLKAHCVDLLDGLTEIINAKKLERYIFTELLITPEECRQGIFSSVKHWDAIRSVIAKYYYSSIYRATSAQNLANKLQELYQTEYDYYQSLIKLV